MSEPGNPDEVLLHTVGIDIGSATSHLVFSTVLMRRVDGLFSSRFRVVDRTTLWESPVVLTPYTRDDEIDDARLLDFVRGQYVEAGVATDDIDTGAVILTGTALLRHNARVVGDILSEHSGRLVCASAGHHFEATLAAHGSGAVARSANGERVLVVDVGGGTTKFALAVDGAVVDTAAITVGARLATWDGQRRISTVHDSLRAVLADSVAQGVKPGGRMTAELEHEIADEMSRLIMQFVATEELLKPATVLLAPRTTDWKADAVTFSGGVSEYVYGRQSLEFGDLGAALGRLLRERWERSGLSQELVESKARIRATVIGAGQHSAQLSGSTIFVGDGHGLPVHGLPVVRLELEPGAVDPASVSAAVLAAAERHPDRVDGRLPAFALSWDHPPEYSLVRGLAEGLAGALPAMSDCHGDLVLAVEQDLAQTLGRLLVTEIGVPRGVVCVDGVELGDLDYLDIGEPIEPAGVVPIVVRSLLFPSPPVPSLDRTT